MCESYYLDAIATTPLADSVRESMLPYLRSLYGNPSGAHSKALDLRDAVEEAREEVRRFCDAVNGAVVVFTGSGTEANNLAVLGTLRGKGALGKVVLSEIEHPSILGAGEALRNEGHEVIRLPVDSRGFLALEKLEEALNGGGVDLVATHLANYDIGTKQDLKVLGRMCQKAGVRVLVDATCGAGWNSFSMRECGVDLVTFSPHRFFGPGGIGVLVLRPGIPMVPILYGGSQEYGLRPGFASVPHIVGAASACRKAREEGGAWAEATGVLQRGFLYELMESLEGVRLNGALPGEERDPHHLSVSVDGVEGEAVLLNLDLKGVQLTSNTGCVSASDKVSPVLTAIGVDRATALGTLVIGLLPTHTEAEMKRVVELMVQAVKRIREMSI